MNFFINLKNTEISYKELTLKDYKFLLKSVYGEVEDVKLCIENLISLISSLTDKPKSWICSLNLLEFICFFIDLRSNSIGSLCPLTLKKDQKTNIDLNLNRVRDLFMSVCQYKQIDIEELRFSLKLPPTSFYLLNEPDSLGYCVERVCFAGKEYNLTSEETLVLLDKMPLKNSLVLNKEIENMLRNANDINIFSMFNNEELYLPFRLSLSSCIWFIKLIFGEPLEDLFSNIFYLSHHSNMSSSYLETCSVGEYKYFVNLLKKTLSPSENL